ncbi:MAG: hypothetical protein MK179_01355 [Pirellulaceae bacterium]|nr:hypothetical protein [Pirellulaceae bacterium]
MRALLSVEEADDLVFLALEVGSLEAVALMPFAPFPFAVATLPESFVEVLRAIRLLDAFLGVELPEADELAAA